MAWPDASIDIIAPEIAVKRGHIEKSSSDPGFI
jgi:hypothetical protein